MRKLIWVLVASLLLGMACLPLGMVCLLGMVGCSHPLKTEELKTEAPKTEKPVTEKPVDLRIAELIEVLKSNPEHATPMESKGPDSTSAIESLIELLKDEDEKVREEAKRALDELSAEISRIKRAALIKLLVRTRIANGDRALDEGRFREAKQNYAWVVETIIWLPDIDGYFIRELKDMIALCDKMINKEKDKKE